MRPKLFFIIILFITISCDKTKVEYHDNGNQKIIYNINKSGVKDGEELEYYADGNIKRKSYYNSGEKVNNEEIYDSIGRIKNILSYNDSDTVETVQLTYENNDTIMTYGNSTLKEDGAIMKIGKYFSYLNKKLIKEEEYINIKNKSYINRFIIYNENNEIDYSRSKYYHEVDSIWIKDNKEYIYKQMIFHLPNTSKFYGSNIYYGLDINDGFSNIDSLLLTERFSENIRTDVDGFGILIEKEIGVPKNFRGVYEYYLDDEHNKKQSIFFNFYYP